MIYDRVTDLVYPTAQPSGTAAQTLYFKLNYEPRRLDGFIFTLGLTTAAGAITGAAWGGLAGVVKEIRVKVNDKQGARTQTQVNGIGLLSWIRNSGIRIDRDTQDAYASAGFAASTAHQVSFFVPIRHPQCGDPGGNALALPLSPVHLNEQVTIEVDLWDIAAGGTVFTTNAPAYTANSCYIGTLVRNVPEDAPYIPSEFRSDIVVPSSAANYQYELPTSGILTSVLIQGLSAAFGNAVTRASLHTAAGNIRFEYGRNVRMRTTQTVNQVLSDASQLAYPNLATSIGTAGVLQNRNFGNEVFIDFLSDLPDNSAFSVASCPNLDIQKTGERSRIVFNDLAAAGRGVNFTHYRLLPKDITDLKALAINV